MRSRRQPSNANDGGEIEQDEVAKRELAVKSCGFGGLAQNSMLAIVNIEPRGAGPDDRGDPELGQEKEKAP
jgi:hypothetical protein